MDQAGLNNPKNTDQSEPQQKEKSKGFGDSFDLLAAYQSMYIDSFEEGKIPAGLQAYLDKKKGKKKDDDDNGDDKKEGKKKAKKDVKEGAGLYANIHAKRKRGGKMRKKGAKGAPSAKDFANAAKTAKEDIDLFDTILNHCINEGYDRKDVILAMSSLTEEQLNEEPITAILGALAAAGKAAAVGVKGATLAAGKGLASAGAKGLAAGGKVASQLKPALGKVSNIAKQGVDVASKSVSNLKKGAKQGLEKIKNIGQSKQTPPPKTGGMPGTGGNQTGSVNLNKQQKKVEPKQQTSFDGRPIGKQPTPPDTNKPENNLFSTDNMMKAQIASSMLSGSGGQKKEKVGTVSASADLFDIVKGQLLDEGLSEEEIKDIMLTLTPEEILNEMGAKFPAGKGANYRETPKPKPQERLGTGRGADYVEKPKPKPGEPGSKFDAKGRKRYTGGMTPYSSENMKDT